MKIRSKTFMLSLVLVALAPLGARAQGFETVSEEARAKPKPPLGFPVVPGVYRLDGTDPNLGMADLEPLRQIIGNAPIVALGESLHTVGGYYEMKHRVFRFLVEKMGFRAISFESNWEAAERVEHYVQTCEGSPEDAVDNLMDIFNSTETAALAQWICEWNRSHPKPQDKVHVFGFDIQEPNLDGPALLAFLERIGVGPDHAWATAVRACDGVQRFNAWPVSESIYRPCVETLGAIRAHFDRNAKSITRQTSAWDFAWARVRLAALRGWQGNIHHTVERLQLEERDEAMAYVFRSIRDLRYRNLRTVIWAHNAHIWENRHPWIAWSYMMGIRLREIYRHGYVSIGLVGAEVETDLGSCAGRVPPPDSAEAHLASLGHDYLLADLASPARPAFFEPRKTYELHFAHVQPRVYFDALIWLRHARRMNPLAWEPCE